MSPGERGYWPNLLWHLAMDRLYSSRTHSTYSLRQRMGVGQTVKDSCLQLYLSPPAWSQQISSLFGFSFLFCVMSVLGQGSLPTSVTPRALGKTLTHGAFSFLMLAMCSRVAWALSLGSLTCLRVCCATWHWVTFRKNQVPWTHCPRARTWGNVFLRVCHSWSWAPSSPSLRQMKVDNGYICM